jgi:hypothetical protein
MYFRNLAEIDVSYHYVSVNLRNLRHLRIVF